MDQDKTVPSAEEKMNPEVACRLFLKTAAAMLLASRSLGQSATTGGLVGSVGDRDGALPGAVVEVVHEPTGTSYTTLTDADGRFRLANLRPGGPYTIRVWLDGYHDQVRTGLDVGLGQTVGLAFHLRHLSTDDGVDDELGGWTSVLDLTKTGSATNFHADLLDSLPSLRRDLDEVVRTSSLLAVTGSGDDVAGLGVAGLGGQLNRLTIDGAVHDFFDFSGSRQPNGRSNTIPISLGAIKAARLAVADFDVRRHGALGGDVTLVTRQGSNDFEGAVSYSTRDTGFFGDGPVGLGKFGDFEEDRFGLRIGGPMSRDEIFFFLDVEIEDRSRPTGWSLDGRSGQAFAAGELTDEATRFRGFLVDRYGFDPGALSENTLEDRSEKYLGRVDAQLGERQRLSLRHNFAEIAREANFPNRSTYEWGSGTHELQSETHASVVQLDSTISNSRFNEVRVAFRTTANRSQPHDGFQFPAIEIEDINGPLGVGRHGFEAGSEPSSVHDTLDQSVFEMHDAFIRFKGDHTLTLGFDGELATVDIRSVRQALGSYQFTSLEDFFAGRSRRFDYTVVASGQPAAASFDIDRLGFYVGDQWAVRGDFALIYGLRLELPFFSGELNRNPVTEELYGLRSDAVPDVEPVWQPRFGFNWNPDGRGQSQWRGGVGVFAGRVPRLLLFDGEGDERRSIRCLDQPFDADPMAQPTVCTASGSVGEFTLIDPDFEWPRVLRFNLGYERQTGRWGLIASADLIVTDSLKDIDYENLNIRRTGTTFDGRPDYDRIDTGVTSAYSITDTSKGQATQIVLGLEHPFSDGFWGKVTYAWTDAEVVDDGTASRAAAAYAGRPAVDPNDVSASRSGLEVEHRFNAALSYRFNRWGDWPTSLSLFYNLQSGRPFSYTSGSDFAQFDFGQSYNGDGSDRNDLFFVPTSAADYLVEGGGSVADLEAFIESRPTLAGLRGRLAPANVDRAPWFHSLDLHLAQTLRVGASSVDLTFDVFNLLNLLDEDSGVLRDVESKIVELVEIEGICGTATDRPVCGPGDVGKPVYSLSNEVLDPQNNPLFQTHNINSRWRAKLGIRWTF